jgi:LmbE family N-acetylglucosaminyl deacetylase
MPGREAIKFIKTTFTGYTRASVKDIFGASVLVLAAHPDDECVAAGALYRNIEKAVFCHLTDGAPGNLIDARARGFKTAGEYAGARRRELLSALSLAGVPPQNCVQAGIADLEASRKLVYAAEWVMERIKEFAPETIITLAYEGGHPDHDAVSFAAHAAASLLRKDGVMPPPLIECPLYHALGRGTRFESSGFIPREDTEPITFILTEEERRLKREMLERFETQSGTLRFFTVEEECFRTAPQYDFTQPPHAGKLFYESFDWGLDGPGWREEARGALEKLGLKGKI